MVNVQGAITNGIKSKERVKEHGEVFTPDSVVIDMLNMVDEKLRKKDMNNDELKAYIKKTYLEPACGNGNFVIRILDSKMQAVQQLPVEEQQLYMIIALCAIYAVDIQDDNVKETRKRVLELLKEGHVDVLDLNGEVTAGWHFTKVNLTPELESLVKYILKRNIQQGNTITGEKVSDELTVIEYIFENENVTMKELQFKGLVDGNDIIMKQYRPINYLNMANAEVAPKEVSSNSSALDGASAEDFDF